MDGEAMASPRAQAATAEPDIEAVELELLLDGVHRVHGYDLRGYARASLRRRIRAHAEANGFASLSALQERVLRDRAALELMVGDVSVHTTAMFRDPEFYRAFRTRAVPLLRTYPFARIWHVGCSTGEEVWSMSILLEEEGLRDRCRIYATDVSEAALAQARVGVFPLAAMKDYTANYVASGGTRSFSDYYTADDVGAVFRRRLGQGIVFARHNLVSDGTFNEFQLVLCRNVLIYFDRPLQDRALEVIDASLTRFGLLVLGERESLRVTALQDSYEQWDANGPIYRKGISR
jgi:chemotaxis protein methyltransferase CheR